MCTTATCWRNLSRKSRTRTRIPKRATALRTTSTREWIRPTSRPSLRRRCQGWPALPCASCSFSRSTASKARTWRVNSLGRSTVSEQVMTTGVFRCCLYSQELAASLLVCAFFSLFPVSRRDEHYLPVINMDTMFEALRLLPSQSQKLHCLVNYFNRVCEAMPEGVISYERKVLPRADNKVMQSAFWSHNYGALCAFEVIEDGVIEDAGWEYAQVDFANSGMGCSGWGACRRRFASC